MPLDREDSWIKREVNGSTLKYLVKNTASYGGKTKTWTEIVYTSELRAGYTDADVELASRIKARATFADWKAYLDATAMNDIVETGHSERLEA